MQGALNFSAFDRAAWTRPDGTLTREAQAAMGILQTRTGGITGLVYANTVVNIPAGGIAATDVQGAIDELDFEKQTKDATLTAMSGVPTAADRLIYFTGSDLAAACDFTSFARSVVAGVNAAAWQTTLGLVIGTNVQAYSANLTTWAGLTPPSGAVVGTTDAQTLTNKTISGGSVNNAPIGASTPATGKFSSVESTTWVKTASTVVASLPAAGTVGAGSRYFVTDASATTFLSIVAGGGGNKVPVVSDGANWLIG